MCRRVLLRKVGLTSGCGCLFRGTLGTAHVSVPTSSGFCFLEPLLGLGSGVGEKGLSLIASPVPTNVKVVTLGYSPVVSPVVLPEMEELGEGGFIPPSWPGLGSL